MSSIVNKVKDALHHDKSHEQKEGTHGPHGSKVANAADPRVDSDRDHRANPASATGMNTHATSNTMAGHGGSSATTGNTTGGGLTGTHGTHGTHGTTTGGGLTGTHGTHGTTTGSGLTGSHGVGGVGSTNAGPHNSNLMNKADPRVDSDVDHRAAPGGMTGSTGMHTGTHGTSTGLGSTGMHSGTHGTSTGVGSGMHSGTHGNTTGMHSGLGNTGPGPAANTAGPHKSDMMNKADPRVDSDLDGSKTVGQDKTFQRA